MSDQKYNGPDSAYKEKLSNGNGNGTNRFGTALRNHGHRDKGFAGAAAKDVSGWDAYRRWLTRVQAPEKRRAPLDPGLYTWKGYRSWSEKVRRDWEPEEH